MNSSTGGDFRRLFRELPVEVQRQARAAFRLFQQNPFHPSLQFKEVNHAESIWSVRVGISYRALGIREGTRIAWFWIGSHADYNHLLRQR